MPWDKILKAFNILFPLIGIGLMIFYEACDTSCSYLQGTFLGIDLKIVGILFMAVLLATALPPVSRYPIPVDYLRTMMLSAAVGGEILLFRFQVVQDTYCPFCLAFGTCVIGPLCGKFRSDEQVSFAGLLSGWIHWLHSVF